MQDMRRLELLVRLAQCGSYTEVARQMQISTGNASKMISRLEKELGVRLFNRNTRLISPTHQGHLFAERARNAIDEISRAVDQLNQEKGQPVGTVRALMSPPIGRSCIIPLLARFQEQYPKIVLEIGFHDGTPDLVEHGFDIAVTDWVAVSDDVCLATVVYAADRDSGQPRLPQEPWDS